MRVGIITALPQETKAILTCLNSIEKNTLNGRRFFSGCSGRNSISILESGMGAVNAERAAESLVKERDPELLISAGLGGGVNSQLVTGDIVLANKILQWQDGKLEKIDFMPFPITPDPVIRSGTFVTGTGILSKKGVAALLDDRFQFPLLEMESAPIAKVSKKHGIPILGVRAVSDPWDEELLFHIEEFCDDSLQIKPGRVLVTTLRKPWILPQLIRLARGSRIAADALAEIISVLISRL